MTQIGVTKIILEKFSICDKKEMFIFKDNHICSYYNIGLYYFAFLFGLYFVPLRIYSRIVLCMHTCMHMGVFSGNFKVINLAVFLKVFF